MRDLIPSTMDSAKDTTPLIRGSLAHPCLFPKLTYVSVFTSMSPSGFLTPTAYLSPFFIIMPSITA